MKRVLVTTDFSALADQAIEPAAAFARQQGGRLILVHVEETEPPPKPDPSGPYFKAARALYEADAEREAKALAELEERARKLEKVEWTAIVGRGSPIRAILELAKAEQADLIVISSQGRTGLKRLILGSVAEELARLSPLPVLIWKSRP